MRSRPALGLPIADIDQLDALLVVGSNLRHEVPILAHRVRKAALRGARISFINPARFDYLFPVAQYRASRAGRARSRIWRRCCCAALGDAPAPAGAGRAAGRACEPTDAHRAIAAAAQERRAARDLARRAGAAQQPLQRTARAGARTGGGDRRQPGRAGRRRQCRRRLPGRRAAAPRRRRRARAPTPGARRGRCSSRRWPATCCSTPSPGPTRRCRGALDDAGARALRGGGDAPTRARR